MIDPSSIARYIKALTYPDSLNGRKPEERSKESAAELKKGQEGKATQFLNLIERRAK